MAKPLFNYRQIDINPETNEPIAPRGGSWMHKVSLDQIESPPTGKLNFVQMCESGFRMTKENKDDSCWDGCTFEDIDYKKYMYDHNEAPDPEEVMGNVIQWLVRNCQEIFYYYEMSRSCKGFHFIFYFNVTKTEHSWMMCKAVSVWAIKKAFCSCGYSDIIEYNGVWDDCTNSFFQACFITKNKSKILSSCDGDVMKIIDKNRYSIEREYNSIFGKKTHYRQSGDKNNRDDWDVEWSRSDDDSKISEYLSHFERWNVFNSLSGLCGDNEKKLNEEWEYCAKRMKEQNGHDTEYYINAPYNLDWDEIRTGCEHIDTEILSKFGYKIKFIKKNDENKKTKETYQVRKERTYIS